jgi:hypothetical protein
MRFDLVCRVVETRRNGKLNGNGPNGRTTNGSIERVRVDLNANLYCMGSCETTSQIEEARSGIIRFSQIKERLPFGSVEILTGYIQESVRLTDYIVTYAQTGAVLSSGTVSRAYTRAPFSGFPSTRF